MRFDVTDAAGRAAFNAPFDLCVIGSGPAGLTLARRVAGAGARVALMEAGGLEWSDASQDVYAGEMAGYASHPLDVSRLRYFGGTSGHWNGLCRARDASGFRARPHNPQADWPISRADLDPYAEETAEILDLTPEPAAALDLPGDAPIRQVRYTRSAPTRFGEKYLGEVTAAPQIFLGLNANLVDLRLDKDLRRIESAAFKSYAEGDPGFAVRARAFALCTGGIENARLLLNFTGQIPQGIGNRTDQVGRFFCDHLGMTEENVAEILFERPGPKEDAFLAPSEAFMAENGTLSAMLRIMPRPRRSMKFVTELAREAQCALPFGTRLVEAVTGRAPGRCDIGGLWEYRRSLDPERYPWGIVRTDAEQWLDPESRVLLAGTRDRFGLRRTRLDWRVNEIDFRSLRENTLALGAELARAGIGRLRVADALLGPAERMLRPEPNQVGFNSSYHHMCSTRMSADPRQGVVDADCRVHDLENLYIGGSSVFASTSYVNPTYTIVQLALRLGDHLGQALQQG